VTHANTTGHSSNAAAGGRWPHPVADTEPSHQFTDDDATEAATWDAPFDTPKEIVGQSATVSPPHRGFPTEAATPAAGQTGDVTDDLEQARAKAQADLARIRLWLPPIEPAVFDCYLGQLATTFDPYTEADQVGVMASLLAAVGAHLGPAPHLQIGYERHPLLVWPLLIGDTNVGKKGTAHNAAKALLLSADTEFVANNIRSGLSTGEGLATVFADDSEEQSGKPGRRRLLPEGDIRLLAFEPEWASVMARMKRENNTLSAMLRQAWEGGDLSTLNVDARVAKESHLGILAHITPEEFKAKVSAADMAGGTYNRFLPIAVAQSKFRPRAEMADPVLTEQLGASLADRLSHASRLETVGFTTAGSLAWERLYYEFTGYHTEEIKVRQFVSRALPYCLRVAAIYAALDRTDRISPAHLAAAAALVRYSIASARAVLHGDTDAALVAWIGQASADGRTKSEITKKLQGQGTAEDHKRVLDRLVGEGLLRITHRPRADGRPGRSAEIYTAAPGN
jgi:Protein of unknown function (DUF3987)